MEAQGSAAVPHIYHFTEKGSHAVWNEPTSAPVQEAQCALSACKFLAHVPVCHGEICASLQANIIITTTPIFIYFKTYY